MSLRERFVYENGPHTVHGFRVGRFNRGINTTFIVYRIGDTLIDAGPSNQWRHIRRELSGHTIRQILITHHHEDHSGSAARLARMTGVTPLAPELGRAKLASGYRTPPVQRLIWGRPQPVETLPLPDKLSLTDGTPVIPVHTPGHAKDLTCFYLPEQKYLFSGDMYISKSLRYLRIDERLQELLDSLRKLLALDIDILFCPHRGIVREGHLALRNKLANLEALCEEARKLQNQGFDEPEIVVRMLGPEDWLSKSSGYNLSKRNLIREALVSY